MLQSQLVDLVFTGGADNKTDSKNTLFSNFQTLENVRVDKLNAVRPRGGFVNRQIPTRSGLGRISSPSFGIVANSSNYIAFEDSSSFVLDADPTGDSDKELLLGSEMRGSASRVNLGNLSGAMGVAMLDDRICSAWIDFRGGSNNFLCVSIRTTEGNDFFNASLNLNSSLESSSLKVTGMGTFFYVLLSDGNNIKAYRISERETTGILAIPFITTTPQTTTIPAARWAVAVNGSNMYIYGGTANNPTIYKCQENGTGLNVVTNVTPSIGTSDLVVGLNICSVPIGTGGRVLAVVGGTAAGYAYMQTFDQSLTQVGTTKSTSDTGSINDMWVAQRDSNEIYWGFTRSPSSNVYTQNLRRFVISLDTDDPEGTLSLAASLISCPFFVGENLYAPMYSLADATYGSNALVEYLYQANDLIADIALTFGVGLQGGSGTSVARVATAVLGNRIAIPSPLPYDIRVIPPTAGATGTVTGGQVNASSLASYIDLDLTKYAQKCIYNDVLLGSVPRTIKGFRQPSYAWPELQRRSFAVSSGSFSGVYSFLFSKTVFLVDGTVFRSYGPIFTANLSSQKVDYSLIANDFAVTGAPSTARIVVELCRTTANGTIFYLDSSYYAAGTTTWGTDSTLVSNRLADINGNELYPEAPGALIAASVWKDRLAAVMVDRPTTVKFNRPGTAFTGLSFADGLELDVGDEKGLITALGAMDNSLYIFHRNSLRTVSGDPAGPTGENGSLTTPTVLRDGLGTTSPRSVVFTPRGLVFQSAKGFYMIMRNQEWVFMGQGPYDQRDEQVTGAAVDEDQAEIYFTYSSGEVWVYNYETSQWYLWEIDDSVYGVSLFQNRMFLSTGEGYAEYRKDRSNDVTNIVLEAEIPQRILTGWLRPGHIRGYQRVKRLYFAGETLQPDTLTVNVYTDYDETPVQTQTFTYDAFTTYEFNLHLSVQKCEALKFEITTEKASLVLSGVTMELGVKQGGDKSRTPNPG